MHAHKDRCKFAEWLLNIAKLKCGHNVHIEDSIETPSSCIVNDIIDNVFDDKCYEMAKGDASLELDNEVLKKSLELNNEVLKKLPGPQHVYMSMDKSRLT